MFRLPRLTVLGLILACSVQVQAAPASQASVEKMLEITHADQIIQQMMAPLEANMRQMAAQARGNTPLTPEQQAAQDRAIQKGVGVLREEFTWEKMKPQYVKLYEDTFSQDEIDGLNAFYLSPAGQAFLAKMPLLMQHSMQMVQSQMQTLMPRMMQAMREAAPAPAPAASH